MVVYLVNTWVVKSEKQEEFMPIWRKFLRYIKENPDKTRELKSTKLFTQTYGGTTGAYVELAEFDSLADCEKFYARLSKDEEWAKIDQEFMLLIDPATLSTNVWDLIA